MSNEHIWIAEAYKDGERIERIIHKNEHDAREDIEISTNTRNPDEIRVEREQIFLGEDTEWHIDHSPSTIPNWP